MRFAEQQQILGNFIDLLLLRRGIFPIEEPYIADPTQRLQLLETWKSTAVTEILNAAESLQTLCENLSDDDDFNVENLRKLYKNNAIPIIFKDNYYTTSQLFTIT